MIYLNSHYQTHGVFIILGHQNIDELPDQMYQDGIQIPNEDLAEKFACMFEKKILDTASTTSIDNNVYNGSKKINEQNKNFMSEVNIRKSILSLKLKNSEGYDRIPQRILIDGMTILLKPFTKVFYLSEKLILIWNDTNMD